MDTQDIGDDIRATELETLEAIYPEIQYPDRIRDPFIFEIELPVQPTSPVTVTFPAAATGNDIVLDLPHLASGQPGASAALNGQQQQQQQPGQPGSDSLNVSHLPSLRLRMTLRDGYPETHPPSVHFATDPQWLSQETLCRLEGDVATLWEDMGRDMVAFAYIDHLQRAAEDVFGAITPEGTLEVDPQHKLAVLDHDIKSKKAAFDKGTFDCGVCLGMFTASGREVKLTH
jgi:E3 ubiquitin-protein ligase RNF14